ncbi:unnamed protein product [Brugia timori]|uniref:Na_Ca_ex domain-containing protein n=1 Tax=Brugia timori TaxID=42155 RepID=A0A0R3QTL7_9BILA|nr:unnamed protein product [Brugia timori]
MLKQRIRVEGRTRKADLAVSLGSCFASGIFLSSCFLGLLPHIRKHEEHIRNMWISTVGHTDSSSYIFLNSELVVLMIFLLILFLEEDQMKRISASGRSSKNMSSMCNDSLMTLIRWDEDAELFITDNPSIEGFTVQTDCGTILNRVLQSVNCCYDPRSTMFIWVRNVHTILLIRFVLEGFAAGAFIYVACVEISSSEMSVHNHGTRQGLFKALAVIISLFTFFFVNIIFGQRLHYSLRYFNIL